MGVGGVGGHLEFLVSAVCVDESHVSGICV